MKAAFSKWCLNNARKAVDGETADLLSTMSHRVSDCIRGIVMGYGKDAMNGGSTLLQQTATGRGVGRPFNYDFTRELLRRRVMLSTLQLLLRGIVVW